MKTNQARAHALITQADDLRQRGKLSDAIAAYREAIRLVPAFGTLNLVVGDMLLQTQRPAEAAEAFQTVLDLMPNHEQAWSRLGQCQLLLGQPEAGFSSGEALTIMEDMAAQKLPDSLGYNWAELSYQEILKREPGSEPAREKLVALYKRTGDTAKALEQQTILINNAEAPEAKCKRTTELATIYEAMGDAKKAEAERGKETVSLGKLPKAQGADIDDRFDALDRMSGEDFENAIAAMSDADREAYARRS